MQDEVNAGASLAAILEVADVAFDEAEVFPGKLANNRFYLIEVTLVTGSKIVEADDPLVVTEQSFEQVRADEAGNPGKQPRARMIKKSQ